MDNATLKPAEPRISNYNMDPQLLKSRAVELPGLTSVKIAELFADSPKPISAESPDEVRGAIRQLAHLQICNLPILEGENKYG